MAPCGPASSMRRSATSIAAAWRPSSIRKTPSPSAGTWTCAAIPSAAAVSAHSTSDAGTNESMILIAHSYFMHHDPKQAARGTPYSPLSTLIAAAMLRNQGHAVGFFDATFARGTGDFEAMLDRQSVELVAFMEDNFNFLTKMCTERRRSDALTMIAAARQRGCRVV